MPHSFGPDCFKCPKLNGCPVVDAAITLIALRETEPELLEPRTEAEEMLFRICASNLAIAASEIIDQLGFLGSISNAAETIPTEMGHLDLMMDYLILVAIGRLPAITPERRKELLEKAIKTTNEMPDNFNPFGENPN